MSTYGQSHVFFFFLNFLCLKKMMKFLCIKCELLDPSGFKNFFGLAVRVLVSNDGLNVSIILRLLSGLYLNLERLHQSRFPQTASHVVVYIFDFLNPCQLSNIPFIIEEFVESGKNHCPLVCQCLLVGIIVLLYVSVCWLESLSSCMSVFVG